MPGEADFHAKPACAGEMQALLLDVKVSLVKLWPGVNDRHTFEAGFFYPVLVRGSGEQ